MANNRLWIKCALCPADVGFFLIKYYPTTGWYVNRGEDSDLTMELDEWLDHHKHGDMWGDFLFTEYEIRTDITSHAKGNGYKERANELHDH